MMAVFVIAPVLSFLLFLNDFKISSGCAIIKQLRSNGIELLKLNHNITPCSIQNVVCSVIERQLA